MDGQPTTAFQGVYADHETLAAKLASGNVQRRSDDGRPLLVDATVIDEEWSPDEPDEIKIVGTMEFGLDDLNPSSILDTVSEDEPAPTSPDGWAD